MLNYEIICRTKFGTYSNRRLREVNIYIGNGEMELRIASGVGKKIDEVRDQAIISARSHGWPFIEICEPIFKSTVFRKREASKHLRMREASWKHLLKK